MENFNNILAGLAVASLVLFIAYGAFILLGKYEYEKRDGLKE